MPIKTHIKRGLSLLLYYSGIGKQLLKKRTAGKCVVLMYHRILPKQDIAASPSHDAIKLTVNTFRKQLDFLLNNFDPIPVDDLYAHLQSGTPFSSRRLLITFDDGWKDNYQFAFPILREYQIPSLIFISTGYIGSRKRFWQEKVVSILKNETFEESTDKEKLKQILFGNDIGFLFNKDKKEKNKGITLLIGKIKSMQYNDINAVVNSLESLVTAKQMLSQKAIDESLDFLNWSEVREMTQHGTDFGSHGVNHLILTKQGVDVDYELRQSQKDIFTNIGQPVISISYPNGNYNERVIRSATSAGYGLGFSTEFGYNDPFTDPYALKRININEAASSTIPLLVGHMLGLW